MYTEFYNLKEKPFNLTPSPKFLYQGDIHKEALALLTYGIQERKGFVLLTGEVGTGKTTVLQTLFTNLDNDVQYVYLSNPLITTEDFINYVAYSVFKTKINLRSKSDFIIEFEEYLKYILQHQQNFVLIIDEAHKLSFDLLEEIRLLSNLETADEKLINIFLVGQPELNEKLNESRCRPLLQRISIMYHMKPLNLESTREYIHTRLRIAGAREPHNIFSKNVIKALHQYSNGYPRMINILADNVLLQGYSEGSKKITVNMVKGCYEDSKLEIPDTNSIYGKPEVIEVNKKETSPGSRVIKWAVLIILLVGVIWIGLTRNRNELFLKLIDALPRKISFLSNNNFENTNSIKQRINENDEKVIAHEPPEKAEMSTVNAKIEASLPIKKHSGFSEEDQIIEDRTEGSMKSIVVKNGDTLAELATKIYGRVNKPILDHIKEHNPTIANINLIDVGSEIIFPPLNRKNIQSSYTVHIASYKPFKFAREVFQKMISEGYEVYIIPIYNNNTGKIFRITLGNFRSLTEAEMYATRIIEQGVSKYANTIQLEMK
ncbi:AAA family ATPase [Thermodesulfobacteriota bacterium]